MGIWINHTLVSESLILYIVTAQDGVTKKRKNIVLLKLKLTFRDD
jgi:hypothetical protein